MVLSGAVFRNLSSNGLATRKLFPIRRGVRYTTSTSSKPMPSDAIPEDPCCDPNNPLLLDFSRVSIAHHKLKGGVLRTDCRHSRIFSQMTGGDVFLKMEVNQDTGSFKERGARFALLNLTEEERTQGVFAASAGNHALALSIHGKKLKIPVTVVMPRHAPIMKITKCKELGSRVIVQGKDMTAARDHALQLAREHGGKYINGYDHIDILAGAGTTGIEILDQVSNPDTILIPIGGGGLVAGVAVAIKALSPKTRIIGLVPETCPSFLNSLKNGSVTTTKCDPTLADGLAVPNVGVNAFHTAKSLVDDVVAVRERDIAVAILRLIENEKVVCEGAGAIGVAAILSGAIDVKGKRVVSILSGGNIDSTQLGRCIERGMAFDGRLVRFNVIVSDRPGGVAELTKIIADTGASVKEMFMERAFLRQDVHSVRVKVVAEMRGREHAEELEDVLKKRYTEIDCNFHHHASFQ